MKGFEIGLFYLHFFVLINVRHDNAKEEKILILPLQINTQRQGQA